MLTYQDKYARNWVWFRVMDPSKNSWGKSTAIDSQLTNNKLITSIAPAIAAVGATFYIVYLDGDPNSGSYNKLVYTATVDQGDQWSSPQLVGANIAFLREL